MCAVLWLTIRQYGEFFLFPHYIPLNLFSKFNENDKLLSECGICPSYIRRIMARSSHTPDTAGTGNDGRQIIFKTLTYGNVDYQNKMLNFEQHKTKGHSQNSGVIIPLNDGLLSLIGSPKTDNISEELIFELPTYESCCKSVKRWVKRAGINKHISWHCARHSFATNILDNGANIVTVANLLGHSGLKHTEKYLRAIDDRKREAINSLPELKI